MNIIRAFFIVNNLLSVYYLTPVRAFGLNAVLILYRKTSAVKTFFMPLMYIQTDSSAAM